MLNRWAPHPCPTAKTPWSGDGPARPGHRLGGRGGGKAKGGRLSPAGAADHRSPGRRRGPRPPRRAGGGGPGGRSGAGTGRTGCRGRHGGPQTVSACSTMSLHSAVRRISRACASRSAVVWSVGSSGWGIGDVSAGGREAPGWPRAGSPGRMDGAGRRGRLAPLRELVRERAAGARLPRRSQRRRTGGVGG